MRIICVSDTHCRLSKIKIPEGDILLHAGDLTFQGNIEEISQEAKQLEKIKHRFTHGIVVVPGNHDRLFERNETLAREIMGDTKVLIDQSLVVDGLNFYGSPHQPWFHSWAYNLQRGEPLREKWALIPENTDVLITHGPPNGILDIAPHPFENHVGCEELAIRVKQLKNLKLHLFGHIHYGYGSTKIDNVTFINASCCTESYKPTNDPWIIEIKSNT